MRNAAAYLPLLLLLLLPALDAPATADGLRDPTRPPAPPAAAAAVEPPPVLSAVMGKEGARVAIFNGALVRGGSVAGAYTIEAVFADGVRYRHAGATREIRLPQATSVKSPSKTAASLPGGAP